MNLIYKNEKILNSLAIVIGVLFWTLLLVSTFGGVLIYLAIGFIIYLFTQSAFIAYIKGNGVKVSDKQFPAIYQQFQQCVQTLEMDDAPEIYIVNSDGLLNALATRFIRKKYVVIYSGVVDALKQYPAGLNFYLGHELGHIKRGHLDWSVLRWPALLLPLLGAAYSRAREYTCDLHGLKCCEDTTKAAYAMAVLACGSEKWKDLNVAAYMEQSDETGSFWMAFHEYTADYPWLSKRMQHIVKASKNQPTGFPRRNPFALLLALFVPRFGYGGGGAGGVIVIVAIIGILAAVALPAYQDYTARANQAIEQSVDDTN